MSLLFSRECEYALQAVTYMALKPDGKNTSIAELAGALNIPFHFLAKILQRLSRKGLLLSTRGATGGFAPRLPLEEMTLYRIVEALDGPDFTRKCLLGFPSCSDEQPCAVHSEWGKVRHAVYEMLESRNILEVGLAMKKEVYESVRQPLSNSKSTKVKP